MAKRKSLLTLPLDASKKASLQDQLAAGLKKNIQSGTLAATTRVPSSRVLADELGISRNTVIAAYDRLIGEGYLEAQPRSGLRVVEGLGGSNPQPAAPSKTRAAKATATSKLFRPSQPDVCLFPLASWARTHSRCLRAANRALLEYMPPQSLGWPALQESLARYLRESRGVHCDPRRIAITTGSQQALYLLANTVARAGAKVCVEDPGYVQAANAFRSAGAALVPVPVDPHGAVVPTIKAPAGAVYLTPSRQFPTGASMPVARRIQWIDFAARTGAWIIEDDYDSEFRFGHAPLPSMQSLDSSGRVIYVGTMSKLLFPALRIGYAVLPEELIAPFSQLREIVDDHGPLVDQAALAEFIDTGAFYRHVKHCRKTYAERQRVFLETANDLSLPLTFAHTDGGMNLTGVFAPNAKRADAELCAELFKEGIGMAPLSRYAIEAKVNGLVFGYTAHSPAAIRNGLKRLVEALFR